MPYFGAHWSVSGGLHNALLTAEQHQCPAVQIFTKNNNQWAAPELTDEQVRTFRSTKRKCKVRIAVAHDSYLINLASPKKDLYRKSIEAFVVEVQRAERLGLRYLVMHPGSHIDSGEEVGLSKVAVALDEVHARCPDAKVKVLLETTAGQGSNLGWRFEHLGSILEQVADASRLGVCFDTCHVFAAGYELAPKKEYRATMRAFDKAVGLSRLKMFHINDSLREFGSRVDRHAHLGKGHLGLEPFRLIVNDSRFQAKPMILETPKEDGDNKEMDSVNLKTLRELMDS